MSSTKPEMARSAPAVGDDGRSLTIAAWLMPLAFLVWFPLMFAAGYWLTDLMGVYPSEGATQDMTEIGLIGWLVAIGYGLVAGLPGWIGAAFAVRARRRGAHIAALLALVVNLLLAALFLVSTLVPS
jgi:hypothetical protein